MLHEVTKVVGIINLLQAQKFMMQLQDNIPPVKAVVPGLLFEAFVILKLQVAKGLLNTDDLVLREQAILSDDSGVTWGGTLAREVTAVLSSIS